MYSEYDNETFFRQYAQMPRSREGLSAAGEWHQLRPLFPDLTGKAVLDLGCGYGWHCRFAAEQGAAQILGIDASGKMIAQAIELSRSSAAPDSQNGKEPASPIEYRVGSLEDYEYPAGAWDCVLSNLALHYIEDLSGVFEKVYRTLKPGGVFLFNIEHPVFTAGVGQDWIYGDDQMPLYWPVDDYFVSGSRTTHFLGCRVVKYHHTLTQILMGLRRCGFTLDVMEEAMPSPDMQALPEMKHELRRPMMLLVRAVKPA
ncbi:MAG: class I SAM-dependent methyltransferase [Eubacteriales bacterium]|nr:class I SAM-dependent methyltransferase [Eubacteriales bacterium]